MPRKEKITEFIKSYYDLAGAPMLALVLLVLEKLMETEFTCPSDEGFRIVYSLIYICSTTLTVCIVVNSCNCRNLCGFLCQHDNFCGNFCQCFNSCGNCCQCCNLNGSLCQCCNSCGNFCQCCNSCGNCCQCCNLNGSLCQCCNFFRNCCQCNWVGKRFASVKKFVTKNKAPIFWLLILVSDGRYFNCLMESRGNGDITIASIKQIIQVIGLIMINLFVFILLCTCETRSKQYKQKHEDIILQYTQKALEKNKKQKLEAFVNQSMEFMESIKVEDYNPRDLDAEEKWEEITENCKNNVIEDLRRAVRSQTQQGGSDLPSGPLQPHEESAVIIQSDNE